MNDETQEWRRTRLAAAAEKAGGDSVLGRLLGHKSGTQVGHMRVGRRPVTEKTVAKIETLPGFDGWFSEEPHARSMVSEGEARYGTPTVRVPLLATSASMGSGSDELHEDVMVGALALAPQWIERYVRPTKLAALRFIHSYGQSMEPTFLDGDVLLVDTGNRATDIEGVFVLRANARLYIKRVRRRMDGCYEISSDNPAVKTVDVLDGHQQVDVLGRVLWAWNGRKL